MYYYVIGDEDTVLGFGMAGVQGRVVRDRGEAEQALSEALNEDSIGIVIIPERIADLIRPLVDRYTLSAELPLILEIPDRLGPKPDRIGIRERVNAAIGIRL